MAPDPVNELKNAIAAAFSENLRQDAFIQEFWKKVQERDNGLTLEDVQKYSEHLGEAASKALRDTVGANALTDERFKQEIASRLVRPMLEQDFDDIQATANTVQKIHDESDGIGLNGLSADFPEERAAGLVEKLSGSENVEEARKYLGEPIVNFHMHGYDSWVHTNAKFRAEAGMTSRIIRRGHFGMCAWCAALVGTFEYDEDSMPRDVFRRHKYCKCVILFSSGRGKVQDVHSKIEYSSIRDARVARLRQLAQQQSEEADARKKALTQGDDNGSIKLPESLNITRKQFGKKVGKHAYDYGLDPSTPEGRDNLREIILDIFQNKEEVRKGPWRGYEDPVLFYMKGEDVVIVQEDGKYISILKGGISNERVENARRLKI